MRESLCGKISMFEGEELDEEKHLFPDFVYEDAQKLISRLENKTPGMRWEIKLIAKRELDYSEEALTEYQIVCSSDHPQPMHLRMRVGQHCRPWWDNIDKVIEEGKPAKFRTN